MSRNFDGVDDKLDFGSDASIDDKNPYTFAFWVKWTATTYTVELFHKQAASTGFGVYVIGTSSPSYHGYVGLFTAWTSGGEGEWWFTTTRIDDSAMHHVCITYDPGDVTNNPTCLIDGITQTATESATPGTTYAGDAANNLIFGLDFVNSSDYLGHAQFLVFDTGIWTDARSNIHRWWGYPAGRPLVNLQLLTSALTNNGSATADATATGATMGSGLPRCERRWGSMMGVGR